MTTQEINTVFVSVALASWFTFVMWGMFKLGSAIDEDYDDEDE